VKTENIKWDEVGELLDVLDDYTRVHVVWGTDDNNNLYVGTAEVVSGEIAEVDDIELIEADEDDEDDVHSACGL